MELFAHKFNINSWSAWGIGALKEGSNSNNVKYGMPALEGINPMIKRRMPLLAKYIYELSNIQPHRVNHDDIPLVFTSNNAELNRTFKIIRSFDGDVSPTQFSMSVHNTIAGLLSIISKNTSIYTVIDSMSGALETALIEAWSLLSDNQFVRIIYFDEDLPKELSSTFPNHNNPIVLNLLIQRGDCVSLTYSHGHEYDETYAKDNFIDLIGFLNNETNSYTSTTKRIKWKLLNHAKI